MLTSADFGLSTQSNKIKLSSLATSGRNVLESDEAQSWFPKDFLLEPGSIKLIQLSRSIKLEGVSQFFDDSLIREPIIDYTTPIRPYSLLLVKKLNSFFMKEYGKSTAITIRLFEINKIPVFEAKVFLWDGTDSFDRNTNHGVINRFRHDAFIGEVIYQLSGGKEAFQYRSDK